MPLDEAAIQGVLDWAYAKAVDGCQDWLPPKSSRASYTQEPGTSVEP
jgi:hypothetical protein